MIKCLCKNFEIFRRTKKWNVYRTRYIAWNFSLPNCFKTSLCWISVSLFLFRTTSCNHIIGFFFFCYFIYYSWCDKFSNPQRIVCMKYLWSFLLYYPSHISYLSSYLITKKLLIFSDLSSVNTILEISRHFYIFRWTFNFTRYIFSTEYRGDFYLSLLYFACYWIFLSTFLILQNTYSTMWYYVCSSSVVLLERLKLFSFSLDIPLKTSNYILFDWRD